MDRYLLKLKHFKDAIQYTYSNIEYNRKFSSCSVKQKKNDLVESNRCSVSRTISTIKELCLCNDFDYFFTLTLKSKRRCDVKWATSKIIRSIKKYFKNKEDYKYLFVFEKQEKGGIHIHGFFSGFYDLYINEYGHLSSKYFDKLGYQNFTACDKVNPFYLIKYVNKKPIEEIKHRYFRSKNLKKADVSYLHANFDEFQNLGFTFKNKYCKMITIAN